MVEIMELYKATHEITLADDIRKHYTGDTESILLALIKGNIFVCRKYCFNSLRNNVRQFNSDQICFHSYIFSVFYYLEWDPEKEVNPFQI